MASTPHSWQHQCAIHWMVDTSVHALEGDGMLSRDVWMWCRYHHQNICNVGWNQWGEFYQQHFLPGPGTGYMWWGGTASNADNFNLMFNCYTNSLTPTPNNQTLTQRFRIGDTSTISYLFTTNAMVWYILSASKPLSVHLPDGSTLSSTHVCHSDIPGLPSSETKGHVIPGMQGYSLISLINLCDAGCYFMVTNNELAIWYKSQKVLHRQWCPKSALWFLPFMHWAQSFNITRNISNDTLYVANIYHTSRRADWLQYLYQACFSPPVNTWCKAVDNDQVISWSGLTSSSVWK